MSEYAYVYILASSFKKLYIGVTTDLMRRVSDHKTHRDTQSHTARYKIDKLVYFERFTTITAAIQREKSLKRWLRPWKVDLITAQNPEWRDLGDQLP